MDRRNFIKTIGVVGASVLPARSLRSEEIANEAVEFKGILVDTTRCAGCQNCSVVCAESHELPEPDLDEMFEINGNRPTTPDQWTTISRFEVGDEEIYVKKQCMHCNQPACATACPTKALLKTEEGPVIWRGDKCMGCRFCMISCPYDIPKFEYDSPNPRIMKCVMCWEKLNEGEIPECVANCPEEAIVFGTRRELIDQAKSRIYTEPDRYVHEIYGEHEVGGTGYLYLAGVPFDQLGFKNDLGNVAYPEYTKTFLYSVPFVITLWPAFLLALHNATKKDEKDVEGGM
jgi:Fe-S-cluster-containing dehydrogenase component